MDTLFQRGHGDGIPWDEPLELVNILNAPAVVKINEWKDVGLELGVDYYDLERIDIECRGKINDCKREMFTLWLRNNSHRTWEKVSHAVKTVQKRVGYCEKRKVQTQIVELGRKAIDALSQLQESLEKLDDGSTNIEGKCTKLAEKWKMQQRKWESLQIQWGQEDKEWNKGEQRKKEFLEAYNAQKSQFVKEFLCEKAGWPDNLSDQDMKCYLTKDRLEKGITRSKQMRSRHQQVQKHQKNLQYLFGELSQWKNHTENVVKQVYTRIQNSLEKLDLKLENLAYLRKQLTKLNYTLRECTVAVEDCDRALREGERYLSDCENQLRMHIELFGQVVQDTRSFIKGLESSVEKIKQQISTLSRALAIPIAAGAAIGTLILPGVGTALGAGTAATIFTISRVTENKEKMRKLEEEIEVRNRTLRNCTEIEKCAEHELKELRKYQEMHHSSYIQL